MSGNNTDDTQNNNKQKLSVQRTTNLFNCGLASGLIQAFVFNPWDRALYLSTIMERPFLHRENFREPMNGVTQTVVQRAISAGLYFPLEEIFSDLLKSTDYYSTRKVAGNVLAGTLAGTVNGVVMNPFCRIKVRIALSLTLSLSLSFSVLTSSVFFHSIITGESYHAVMKTSFLQQRKFYNKVASVNYSLGP
jgi:hypothetical protein